MNLSVYLYKSVIRNCPMKNLLKNLFIIVIIFVLVSAVFSLLSEPNESIQEITLTELAQEINNEKVDAISVNGQTLEITLKDKVSQISFVLR